MSITREWDGRARNIDIDKETINTPFQKYLAPLPFHLFTRRGPTTLKSKATGRPSTESIPL